MTGIRETRLSDIWPLCPKCGEDEAYSLDVPPTPQTIIGCYRCGLYTEKERQQFVRRELAPADAPQTNTIMMACDHAKCPRALRPKKVVRAQWDPPSATVYVLTCPWHSSPGGFDNGVYLDAQGKEIRDV